ncbi:MAG: TauD/TfdA family dioxygenase [Gammaproteobacteria bacterium]|nr:TauD/TfdA family dioxygenase [Gammaproteobacteria bacterium]
MMEVEKFAAPLGATIRGIDVTDVDEATWHDINALFLEHHVLHFPAQSLSPETQIAFANRWGELVRASLRGHE